MEPLNIRTLRARAGRLLSRGEYRLTVILAEAIFLLAVAAVLMTGYSLYVLSLLMQSSVTVRVAFMAVHVASSAVLILFLVSPLAFGLFHMAGRIAQGNACELWDLFYAFRDGRRFFRSMKAMLPVSLSAILLLILSETTSLIPQISEDWFFSLLLFLIPVVGIPVALALSYPRIYCLLDDRAFLVPDARESLYLGFRLFGGYALHLLLGVLTVGVLLIADVFPRMMISYMIDCEEACVPLCIDVSEERSIPSSCDK